MPVNIKGKEYFTVAERVDQFREENPDWSIVTKIIKADDYSVIARTRIYDRQGCILSTGWAEEIRGKNTFIKDAEVELAETSAVGRALAFYKYAGSEIASADEVANAIQSDASQPVSELLAYYSLVRDNFETISEIKTKYLVPQWGDDGDAVNASAAIEAFEELSHDTQIGLWKAPSKGGIFTTLERKLLKQPDRAETENGVKYI